MRKIILLTMVSLDGVLQAPGGPDEDRSGGFAYGGWTFPYMDDFSVEALAEQMAEPFDLLLGRKTYDIFAAYWPKQSDRIGTLFNKVHKYVASHTSFEPTWQKTTVLTGDVVGALKRLKAEDGPDLQVYGSGDFAQTLLKNDLADEIWLKIFPVTLGSGKRLFAEGTIPAAFKLVNSKISPLGVIFANYKRAGEVKTGLIGE
jgi:dihydrofolate reductase